MYGVANEFWTPHWEIRLGMISSTVTLVLRDFGALDAFTKVSFLALCNCRLVGCVYRGPPIFVEVIYFVLCDQGGNVHCECGEKS